jgi:uncharacterized protein
MIYPRKLLQKLQKYAENKEIIVLTGMRRVGKTTLLRYIYDQIASENKLFLDVGSPITQSYFDEIDYDNIWLNLEQQGLVQNKKAYVFLDEIQDMPEIVKAIKYLYDHYDIKFFVTGSSSYYLKKLFPESLAGRKYVFELFPLDFTEFLVFKGIDKKFYPTLKKTAEKKNKINYEKIKKYYEEYLEWGGFPEVVLEDDIETKKLKLEDILKSYFEQDVRILADFSDISKFRKLMFLLMQRVGSKMDITKLASEIEVTRPTVYSYLSFLQATYFVNLISPYTKNVDREISGTDKVYVCDTGLINAFAKVGAGSILENAVYLNLRNYGKLNYYEKRKGGEIDFVVNQKSAVEVKTKAISQHMTKLNKLAKTLNLKETYVISKEFVNGTSIIIAQDL